MKITIKVFVIFMILLSGCIATKQIETKNHTYELKGKEVKSFNRSEKAYKLNAQGSRVFSIHKFPTKDSTTVKIEYREGKTDTIVETITEFDTINNVEVIYKTKYIHRVDTIVKDSTITIQDTREIDALRTENSTIRQDVVKAQDKASLWQKIAFVSIGLLVVLGIVILKR